MIQQEHKVKKIYLSNKDLYCEILVSKAKGKLTKDAEKMLILLCKNVIKKMSYFNPDDRLDCLQTAYLQVFSNWASFDENKGDNCFAFYTEVIKRALAQGWNKLHKKKGDEKNKIQIISLTSYDDSGNSYDRF